MRRRYFFGAIGGVAAAAFAPLAYAKDNIDKLLERYVTDPVLDRFGTRLVNHYDPRSEENIWGKGRGFSDLNDQGIDLLCNNQPDPFDDVMSFFKDKVLSDPKNLKTFYDKYIEKVLGAMEEHAKELHPTLKKVMTAEQRRQMFEHYRGIADNVSNYIGFARQNGGRVVPLVQDVVAADKAMHDAWTADAEVSGPFYEKWAHIEIETDKAKKQKLIDEAGEDYKSNKAKIDEMAKKRDESSQKFTDAEAALKNLVETEITPEMPLDIVLWVERRRSDGGSNSDVLLEKYEVLTNDLIARLTKLSN